MRRAAAPHAALPLVVLALGLGACASGPPPAPEPAPLRAPEPPPLDPGVLSRVTAVAAWGDRLYLGTEAGLLSVHVPSGRYLLLAEDRGVSHAAVSSVSVTADGTAYSGHWTSAAAEGRTGGVRAFTTGGELVGAWFGEDGAFDEVAAVAAGEGGVAAAGEAVAVLEGASDDGGRTWRRHLDASRRPLDVISRDEAGSWSRSVIEFRRQDERFTSVAWQGEALWAGSTHGLYRIAADGSVERHDIPCRTGPRPPNRVQALAVDEDRVVAVIAVPLPDGEWAPGGMLELTGDGFRCHEVAVDVPDAPSLSVAASDGWTWLATYVGPTRIEPDGRATLLDEFARAPEWPATSVDSADEGCWVGTWGGGAYLVAGDSLTRLDFKAGGSGHVSVFEGELR